uniref:phosphoribosylaminoimidazolesuccinocarboxamide synthase n=1 Tax=Romanomermis culicivorax TaxID=13658 RepID=A0A915I686_ROMCU
MTPNDYESIEKIETMDLNTCEKLAEGKTKIIYQLPKFPNYVAINSKDKITAFNAVRQHELEGKAALSNEATCRVFDFLNFVGFPSHFVKRLDQTTFLARKCQMIPIEWVARRVATGSFLKRNQGVPEGFRFSPPKMEMFFKVKLQYSMFPEVAFF